MCFADSDDDFGASSRWSPTSSSMPQSPTASYMLGLAMELGGGAGMAIDSTHDNAVERVLAKARYNMALKTCGTVLSHSSA